MGGRGLVATTNIDRGSLILTDEPLVIIDTTLGSGEEFYESEKAGSTRIINEAFRHAPKKVKALRALHGVNDIDKVEKNAWGFDNPSVNSNRWVVVGKYLSRINHSCVPNAVVTDVCTDPGNDFGTMRLISTRDIKMNDEILVEYNRDLDDIWLQPRERRR